jgi:ferrous iron transport protein B
MPLSLQTLTIALAGNPNSGKTTLFNALTGLRQRVANYPGVTVEKKIGAARLPGGRPVTLIDLPGAYSLIPTSPDERVTMEVLRGLRPDTPPPDVVIAVIDASNLPRNLYFLSQLIELGRPMVVALTMSDLALARGQPIDHEKLSQRLGVPVIPVVGHRREGMNQLLASIERAAVAPLPAFPLPDAFRRQSVILANALASTDETDQHPALCFARGGEEQHRFDRFTALAERMLTRDPGADLDELRSRLRFRRLIESAESDFRNQNVEPVQADIEAHYRWVHDVLATCRVADLSAGNPAQASSSSSPALSYATPARLNWTERLDRILLHKVLGLMIFAAVMTSLFLAVFIVADPIMGAVEGLISSLGESVVSLLPPGDLASLLQDGIFAGVGGVLVFVPQIALLYVFLAILEDTGYLARAAFLMDKLLGKVGLSGKSFVPLLSSFACAIPGIMAARTIESPRQRLATIMVAPFMSCSARLPVYTLLIGMFFAAWGAGGKAGVMLACYALGIIAAAATAWVAKLIAPANSAGTFILELPPYRWPIWRNVLRHVYSNTAKFVTRAGTIILALTIVLWALAYYPRMSESEVETARTTLVASGVDEASIDNRLAEMQLAQSISGRFGHAIEPAIRPLGYDWKMGVGLVGAFAAREIFVSQMGVIYSVGAVEDETAELETMMRADQYPDGRPVWTTAVAVSLLVWFVLAMQCMSTVAIVWRETNSWKWAAGQLIYMNALAYVAAFIAYRAALAMGL